MALVEVYRGDSKTLRISIVSRDPNNLSLRIPVDSTGWRIDFTVRQTEAGTILLSKSSTVPGEIVPVDIDQGIWDINLLPADTALAIGTYVYDVQGTTDDAPAKIYTVIKDAFKVLQDVTP